MKNSSENRYQSTHKRGLTKPLGILNYGYN